MSGRGPRGNSATCLALGRLSVTSAATHKKFEPFWFWFLGAWFCVRSRTPWVSPTNSPVRLIVSPAASTPTGFFSERFWGFIFPCWNSRLLLYLAPQLFLLVYLLTNVGPPALPATASPAPSSTCYLAAHPLCPRLPVCPLLPVWMNVSSLSPWLLDFQTVQFSGSSGYFFVFKFFVVLLLFVQGLTTYASIWA